MTDLDQEQISLELATLDQIFQELGRRTAYGNFVFVTDDKMLIGKDVAPDHLRTIVQGLAVIADYDWERPVFGESP